MYIHAFSCANINKWHLGDFTPFLQSKNISVPKKNEKRERGLTIVLEGYRARSSFLAYFLEANSTARGRRQRYATGGRTQSNAYPLFRTADLFAAQRQSHFDPFDGKDLARPSSYL